MTLRDEWWGTPYTEAKEASGTDTRRDRLVAHFPGNRLSNRAPKESIPLDQDEQGDGNWMQKRGRPGLSKTE